jgi:hypothetical protein
MTGLNRTDLPTSHKVQLAASALAGQGIYGAITDLAQTFEVSRPTVYAAALTAELRVYATERLRLVACEPIRPRSLWK